MSETELIERVARAIEPETFLKPRINLYADLYERAYTRARSAIDAMAMADILQEAKKALEYSSSSLESIESYDDEDRDTDGGSKVCRATVSINQRAIAKIEAALASLPTPNNETLP